MRRAALWGLTVVLCVAGCGDAEPDAGVGADFGTAEELRDRRAVGNLSTSRLKLAAYLGYPPACEALGRPVELEVGDLSQLQSRIRGLKPWGREALVRAGLACARTAQEQLADPPTSELDAIDAWLACPCAAHADACDRLKETLEDRVQQTLRAAQQEPPKPSLARDVKAWTVIIAALLVVTTDMDQQAQGPLAADFVAAEAASGVVQLELAALAANDPSETAEAAGAFAEGLVGGGHGREDTPEQQAQIQAWLAGQMERQAQSAQRLWPRIRAELLHWCLAP